MAKQICHKLFNWYVVVLNTAMQNNIRMGVVNTCMKNEYENGMEYE